MKKILFIIILFIGNALLAQDTIHNGYQKFYYTSGKISSEGLLVNGKPDGYWKTYYEDGYLKSEGNRKNFELDSVWKFYADSSKLNLEIIYKNGKKNGYRTTYLKDETIKDFFIDDIKDSLSLRFYKSGALKSKTPFKKGREEGRALEYSPDGNITAIKEYKKGYLINTEYINKTRDGLKHGVWKTFYDNDIVKSEGNYFYGKKDGYFKEFDKDGNLLSIKKYRDDFLEEDAPELQSLEIKTMFYPNGKKRIVQSFKDDIPQGIRREYDQEGKIIKSYIFKDGRITGEGIVDEEGMKQGFWTEFYDNGDKEGEGNYTNGKKTGKWNYFFKSGTVEQTGTYNEKGKPDGQWKWYYESGNLRKSEMLSNGKLNGEYKELSDSGSVIIQGEYADGEEEGPWIYSVGDEKEVGNFTAGKREGEWKHYFENGELNFVGSYMDGLPNDLFIYYWPNGKVKEKGKYIMGLKEGDWNLYDETGVEIITIRYKDGIEVAYDGVKIPFEE